MKNKNKFKRKLKQNFGKILIIGNLAMVGIAANFNLMAVEWPIDANSPIIKNHPKTQNLSLKTENLTLLWPEETNPIKQYVLTRIYEAGLNPNEAEKIIACESQWRPDAHAVNWNNKKGVDRGLWMINTLYHPEVSNADAYDYKKATEHAIRIYKEWGDWRAWSCSKKL